MDLFNNMQIIYFITRETNKKKEVFFFSPKMKSKAKYGKTEKSAYKILFPET